MNPHVKDKWIKALRGGKYPQTRQVLRDEMGFCCLGVLCDVLDPDGWYVTRHSGHRHQGSVSVPQESILAAAGMVEGHEAGDNIPGSYMHLARMNDVGHGFHEIADVIEKYR